MKFSDPTGLEDNPSIYDFVQDLDELILKNEEKTAQNIYDTCMKHVGESYVVGTPENGYKENRCDQFNEKVINESDYKSSDYMAGPADSKKVDEHIKWSLDNKLTTKIDRNDSAENVGSGAYVVYMGDGKYASTGKSVQSHTGLIVFLKQKVFFIDNSSHNYYNEDTGKYDGGVEAHEYDNLEQFQNDYGVTYASFYYLKINEGIGR